MLHLQRIALGLFAAGLVVAAPAHAVPADTSGTLYALITPPSSLEVGCLPPCACPSDSVPTYGSFLLVPRGSDPLYSYYDVERYIVSFNNGPGAVSIVGSGRYRIGGEVAAMQQLTLDLEVWGGPPEHFDSGLVPVDAAFPVIDVKCAVHGFTCYDSVLRVRARPAGTTGIVDPGSRPAGIQAVLPTPFTSRARIAFRLERPGPVDLSVLDLGGRHVRTLAAGWLAGAGPGSLIWDGRDDEGRTLPAGVYWVALRWPEGADRRRVIKLD